MRILSDCHLHSSFSGDSETPMEQMIQRGVEVGLQHMCFTEHLDIDFPVSTVYKEGTFLLDIENYQKVLRIYAEKYSERINILQGIEVGLQTHLKDEDFNSICVENFDFIIGSCHVCKGMDICSVEYYEGKTEREALEDYFAETIKVAKQFGNYDVFGHLDYILRYSPYKDYTFSYEKYADYYDTILRLLIEKGKGIELNTGGLMKGLKEPHPCIKALKRYKELGGEIITVGSDAHCCKNIAGYFNKAAEVLFQSGFRYYTVFKDHKPEFFEI
jgi:histidinol-phosphatase (PHP family)|nr:histidinol-phosphatase HisJ family protein [uncultured Lachnoclostridium sp.]